MTGGNTPAKTCRFPHQPSLKHPKHSSSLPPRTISFSTSLVATLVLLASAPVRSRGWSSAVNMRNNEITGLRPRQQEAARIRQHHEKRQPATSQVYPRLENEEIIVHRTSRGRTAAVLHMASSSPDHQNMSQSSDNAKDTKTVEGDEEGGIVSQASSTRGGAEEEKWLTAARISVGAVLLSAFLNLLGFTMAQGPITPALGQHFNLKIGASFGSLTSAYPLGMLLGLFLWPQLSDKIGRKPVITASLLGSGLGLAAQSYVIYTRTGGLYLFLATRVLTGSFAGSSPVSKAYLADVGSAEGKLPRYLALRDAACTMAFILGPLFGGIAYDVRRRALKLGEEAVAGATATTTGSLAFVIGLSAAASLAASALVALCVSEDVQGGDETDDSNTKKKRRLSLLKRPSKSSGKTGKKKEVEELISCPLGVSMWAGVATVCVVSFLFNVGDSTFHAFFPALLKEKLQLDARSIGFYYTLLACVSFGVSATTSAKAVRALGPVATCVLGMTACGMGLFGLGGFLLGGAGTGSSVAGAAVPAVVIAAAALYYCGVPLYGPTIPTMLLRCVPKNRRGAVMGLDGAINTMARVISPLVMGDLYRRRGASAAFGVAGSLVTAGAVTAMVRRWGVLGLRRKNEEGKKLLFKDATK